MQIASCDPDSHAIQPYFNNTNKHMEWQDTCHETHKRDAKAYREITIDCHQFVYEPETPCFVGVDGIGVCAHRPLEALP